MQNNASLVHFISTYISYRQVVGTNAIASRLGTFDAMTESAFVEKLCEAVMRWESCQTSFAARWCGLRSVVGTFDSASKVRRIMSDKKAVAEFVARETRHRWILAALRVVAQEGWQRFRGSTQRGGVCYLGTQTDMDIVGAYCCFRGTLLSARGSEFPMFKAAAQSKILPYLTHPRDIYKILASATGDAECVADIVFDWIGRDMGKLKRFIFNGISSPPARHDGNAVLSAVHYVKTDSPIVSPVNPKGTVNESSHENRTNVRPVYHYRRNRDGY
jgi:hypothetical protein